MMAFGTEDKIDYQWQLLTVTVYCVKRVSYSLVVLGTGTGT